MDDNACPNLERSSLIDTTLQARLCLACSRACRTPTFEQTNWEGILGLYDALIAMKKSPVYELNRATVVARIQGPQAGIREITRLQQSGQLSRYYLLDTALGQLHADAGARACAGSIPGSSLQNAVRERTGPHRSEACRHRPPEELTRFTSISEVHT